MEGVERGAERRALQGDLLLGLRIGWVLGGVAMLLLGIILLALFAARLRGESRPLFPRPSWPSATSYGAWALGISGDPFFTVFIVPGALLAVASLFRS